MKNLRFLAFGLLLTMLSSLSGLAQDRPQVAGEESKPSRWVLGGDFGLGFSSFGFNARIAPQLGYLITPRWEAGIRLTYLYNGIKDMGVRYHFHDYGGGFYTSYDVYKGFFLYAENELLNYNQAFFNTGVIQKDRVLIHSVFVGVGYRQYFGPSSSSWIMLLYNLNETIESPYSNPLFRVGFGFGL